MNNGLGAIHPIQLFFLTYMMQTSVAIFILPRSISEAFGTNSWIMLIVLSGIVMVNIFLFQLVYKKGDGMSVFEIMNVTLPRMITFPIYIVFAVSWSISASLILKEYIYIIQLVAFPTTSFIYLLSVLIIVVLFFMQYPIYKMIRAAGVLFGLASVTIILTVFIWPDFSIDRLTPFIFKGTNVSFDWLTIIDQYRPFLGFELCLFLFPYVTKDSHLFRSFYLGNAFTTFIYVYTVVLCLGFYSFDQLQHIIYPTLHFFSFIEFPFLIRIENLVYSIFLVKALVTAVFYYWISKQAIQQIIKRESKFWLPLCIIAFSVFITYPFTTKQELELSLRFAGRFHSVLIFILPLLLLLLLYIQKKVRK
ncbi:hypothetical protein J2S78_002679 [Salibacterium salarium]|uniref:GerAB/ArcD/ProY family transporter n=1 Tax=Salibacterium salarium TaxID=284579 RepID=UPI002782FB0D|nr:GerAB/ArcD/ProY family transporter [Salibacterium salarium]MDQ0300232.1 hypothetical protein [Salibacterium salarium]